MRACTCKMKGLAWNGTKSGTGAGGNTPQRAGWRAKRTWDLGCGWVVDDQQQQHAGRQWRTDHCTAAGAQDDERQCLTASQVGQPVSQSALCFEFGVLVLWGWVVCGWLASELLIQGAQTTPPNLQPAWNNWRGGQARVERKGQKKTNTKTR
jgi:hypothetical protein